MLVDYISRNPFAKAEKFSTYDEHFVVATISNIFDSMKHSIKNKKRTILKLNSISNSPSNHPNQLIAPQMPTSVNNNPQL